MIDVNRQGEVWVFAEQHGGLLEDTPIELMSKGRIWRTFLVSSLVRCCWATTERACEEADSVWGGQGLSGGASAVRALPDEQLHQSNLRPDSQIQAADCDLRRDAWAGIWGPRIASATKAGLTADCTDLQIGDHKTTDGQMHKNLLFQIRPAFGGNIIATIINYDRWPQMATVREGVMVMATPDTKRKGQVITEKVQLSPQELPIEILEEHTRAKKVDLKAARIIVAGGAGVGSKDNFRLIWDLANCLGAAPAATRAAVDLGFIDHDHQVGQTGTTVRPSLYIAVGISGAIQHQAGMSQSQKIVAINNDPQAPIFRRRALQNSSAT